MRLIDADALKEKAFFHEIDNVSYVEEEDIDKAPTISPDMAQVLAYECGKAERKRGEWVDDGLDAIGAMGIEYRWKKCPNCGERISKAPMQRLPNFCSNCGTDMRTKETDRDYERAVEQLEHDMLYEPTYNPDDGSM